MSKTCEKIPNLEIRYEGRHKYGLYLDGKLLRIFDSFDEAADEFEALGGLYDY